jgi:hypothetical protein
MAPLAAVAAGAAPLDCELSDAAIAGVALARVAYEDIGSGSVIAAPKAPPGAPCVAAFAATVPMSAVSVAVD